MARSPVDTPLFLFRHEMRTTILLITVFILLLAEGPRFSVARDLELRGLDTQVVEILLGGTRPLLAQDEVVRQGASFIAMAFDQHGLAPIGAKPSSIAVQYRHGILANLKSVVIEKHVAQSIAARGCARREREIGW